MASYCIREFVLIASACRLARHDCQFMNRQITGDLAMWTKPKYENVRLGFEITMYFSNR